MTDTRPRGRPPNHVKESQLLLEDATVDLIKKAINLARLGDTAALEICLDRVLPRRPRIHLSETGLRQAVKQGIISPGDAAMIRDSLKRAAEGC